jgi:NAD(P)-dependent dehydrogenase (short-subunit alcohol dehydrogenase family)
MSSLSHPPGLPLDLTGRIVFVSGGGSAGPGWSIGRASSVTYARLGAKVCVVDRDTVSAEETTKIILQEGGIAQTFVGDVSEEDEVKRLFSEARNQFGPIDVLHHNVGVGKVGGPMETSAEDFDRVHKVNVRSLLLAAQEVLPEMASRGTGNIIAISSVAGMRPIGTCLSLAARASSRPFSENIFATVLAMRGVSIKPGTTVLARMP